MDINIKLLNENAVIPICGSEEAAGMDLYATEDTSIFPHTMKRIGTGIAIAIPSGYFGGIFARSGLSTKQGLRPANCVGVIDSDYRGEIQVALYNDSEYARSIKIGDKIAQLLILPYLKVNFNTVTDLDETVRGEGGFGSTDNN